MATKLLPPSNAPARKRTSLHALQDFTDAQLLERFTLRQSEAAFAVLVERHGPLVLGVCRRVLQNAHDTEDAFQAAFLILARKAHTIHQHQSLASWLYKVAYRIALRARAGIARRRTQEMEAVQSLPSPSSAAVGERKLGQLLDEEVQRLPEKYRAPVLLCYLQGQTNEQAARQLSCPTGTLKIRLMRARDLLRKRLSRRGVGLSLAALWALLQESAASAALPATLAQATVGAATTGGASAGVAGLVHGTLVGMCLTKLKVAAALLLTVVLGSMADGLSRQADTTAQVEFKQQVPSTPPVPLLVVSR